MLCWRGHRQIVPCLLRPSRHSGKEREAAKFASLPAAPPQAPRCSEPSANGCTHSCCSMLESRWNCASRRQYGFLLAFKISTCPTWNRSNAPSMYTMRAPAGALLPLLNCSSTCAEGCKDVSEQVMPVKIKCGGLQAACTGYDAGKQLPRVSTQQAAASMDQACRSGR